MAGQHPAVVAPVFGEVCPHGGASFTPHQVAWRALEAWRISSHRLLTTITSVYNSLMSLMRTCSLLYQNVSDVTIYIIYLSIYADILHYAPLCSSLQCLPGCVPHLIASPPLSHRLTSGGRTYADNQTPEPSTPVRGGGQMEEKWTKEVLIITFL